MRRQLYRITLFSILTYLAQSALNTVVAASQPSGEQEVHFCGGTGFPLDEPYSDQSLVRRYNRLFASNINVGEPRTVRMIYFLPNDRPYRADVVQKMKDEIRNVQTFYAEQMEAHGYGDLTFRYETDVLGDPMVHRVDGGQPDSHYLYDTQITVNAEIQIEFNLNADVYLIVIDNSTNAIGLGESRRAQGIGGRTGKNSGFALVSGAFGMSLVAHELGHAFGLEHDFNDGAYIMSYGSRASLGPVWSQLSTCHAEFLSVHPYFNLNASTEEGTPPIIKLISSPYYPAGSNIIPMRFNVSDAEGLQQILLFLRTIEPHGAAGAREVKACRGLAGKNDTIIQFDYDGVIPSDGFTSLSHPAAKRIYAVAVDVDGNEGQTNIRIAESLPHHIATFRKTTGCKTVSFSPNFTTIAAGGNNKKLQLWHLAREEMIATFTLPNGASWVNTVSFSPNGKTLAAGGWDWVGLWDVATGCSIASFRSPSTVNSVSISTDEMTLAAGGSDGTVQVWDARTKQILAIFRHTGRVSSVAFSRDGNILASGSADSPVKLWDVVMQQEIDALEGHTKAVYSLAFSPNGTTLATGSADRRIGQSSCGT